MDGVMLTYVGDAQPLLTALATAVAVSFLKGARASKSGLDRYRVMQAATGYIIAAFASLNTAVHTRAKVLEARWPAPWGMPEGHELEGMKIAYWVLNNLNPKGLAEQIADIAEILKSDLPTGLEII
jgi:hypothetical protein